MAKVVDIEEGEEDGQDVTPEEAPPRQEKAPRPRREPVEVEIEKEITKRQLIQSVSSLVVVILYMLFTLLRDRETGVVVIDPDEDASDDDWAE